MALRYLNKNKGKNFCYVVSAKKKNIKKEKRAEVLGEVDSFPDNLHIKVQSVTQLLNH